MIKLYITVEPENESPSSDSLEPGGARFSYIDPLLLFPATHFHSLVLTGCYIIHIALCILPISYGNSCSAFIIKHDQEI